MIFVVFYFILFYFLVFYDYLPSLLLVGNSVAVYVLFDILSLFVSASLKVYDEDKEQELLDRII